MNQILSTQNNNKQKKNNISEMLDMKKIIIIFSILVIIFAVVIVSAKGFGLIKEKAKDVQGDLNQPNIEIKIAEGQCVINIKYDEGLDKVSYYWNETTNIKEFSQNGSTEYNKPIDIPEGDYNVLYVTATGVDGSVKEIKQEVIVKEEDKDKPTISWYFDENTKEIDIVAESEKGLKSLSYQWEDEEAVVLESTEENEKRMEVRIEARRGINKITITATDIEGKTQTKQDTVKGTHDPEIIIQIIENKTLYVSITHDMGFKSVYININGEEMIYDETHPEYSPGVTNINTKVDLEPGTLTVKYSVYTLENETKEYTREGTMEIPQ